MLNSFQSTLRRTERLVISNIFPPVLNFNPRSDERSDSKWLFDFDEDNEISIHAPTNGATVVSGIMRVVIPISIHAPTNGATCGSEIFELFSAISIHAPTNGAT